MINFTVKLGGLPLYTYCWALEEGRLPKAVVQVVHGVSEHMGRYDEFASFLNDYGYEVIGHDHPGHGMTGPVLGEVSGDAMSLLLGGITEVRDVIRRERPGVPVILFGHSMGSFLALRSMEMDPQGWDALILSGTNDRNPLIMERFTLLSESLLRGIKKNPVMEKAMYELILKGSHAGILNGKKNSAWRTRDQLEVKLFDQDPACGFEMNLDFMKSLAKGQSVWYRKEELSKLEKSLSILIISGTQDHVGNYGKGAARLAKSLTQAEIPLVYLRFYEGARHDLLWEESRSETMYDILEFLKLAVKEQI